jgi:hypothetical protein
VGVAVRTGWLVVDRAVTVGGLHVGWPKVKYTMWCHVSLTAPMCL